MFRNWMHKVCGAALAVLIASSCAWAQYGGGGGTMTGGTYNPNSHSYGHGAVIGAVAGAAAGGALLFYALHHHRQVVGCVTPDGKSLTTDDGKHTYQLAGSEQVTAGEHLAVVGKTTKGSSGIDELEVFSVKKHLGQCEQQAALVEQHP